MLCKYLLGKSQLRVLKIKQSFFAIIFVLLIGSACVFGNITYTLDQSVADADPAIRDQIETSIAEAVALYNQRGSFNKHLNIYYNSSVPTADGNYNGNIRFGGSRSTRTALHEISHTLGVGTYGTWSNNISGGLWTGSYATNKMHDLEGLTVSVHADGMHFWDFGVYTYGLNYASEDGTIPRLGHIQMIANLRADMGLLSFTEEPISQTVASGDTAVFNVVAPGAVSYLWYKNGVWLTDGGDIAGSTTNTLTISNVDPTDEGDYYCVVSGSLSSRPARLAVDHWELYKTDDFTLLQEGTASTYEVGNKFVTGTFPPTITALGFIDLNNTDSVVNPDGDGLFESHRVTLWRDSNGSKVAEVIVPAGSDGHLIGNFRYTEIPEGSLTLAPNTAYVISADTTGIQDAWLDEEVLTPNGYFIDNNLNDSTTWQGRWGTPGQRPASQWHTGTFYGLANITSKVIPVVTGSTNFFTQSYSGTRNNFTGWAGYEFQPTEDINIDRLGRAISGSMDYSHDIRIWRVSDQSLIAAVTVTPSGPVDAFNYAYAELGSAVTLSSGVIYRIASSESLGGDQFMDYGTINGHADIANIIQPVWGAGSYPANTIGDSEQGYVPPTFYFDNTPPTPNPATFTAVPAAVSGTVISMTATTGTDANGPVEYYFDETSGNPGGTDSGWQTSPSYTDFGLLASTQYTYTVQMRDAMLNTGTASSPASPITFILRTDYDNSGGVDFYDLTVLSQVWLQDAPLYDIAPEGGDGILNFLDFQILAEEWAL